MGNDYLNKGAFGNSISTYHLEAAIAYQHCTAPDFASTNWRAIVQYYDALLQISNDAVVALNRCLALLELQGPDAAFEALQALPAEGSIQQYYLYHAAFGEVHLRMLRPAEAAQHFERALALTQSDLEKKYLRGKIAVLRN